MAMRSRSPASASSAQYRCTSCARIAALQVTRAWPWNRACCTARARTTRSRMVADDSPRASPVNSWNRTAGTST
jgi:hypothetical protein